MVLLNRVWSFRLLTTATAILVSSVVAGAAPRGYAGSKPPSTLANRPVGKPAVAAISTASAPAAVWYTQESSNLRVLCYGKPIASGIVAECEALRQQLCERWLSESETKWQPKCDIVLHSSDKSYLSEVGAAGRNTLASSLVKQADGRVASRRIDILATRDDWSSAALPHELTHVILADVVADNKIPRWLDEGLAILADPAEKQYRHRCDLHQAFTAGSEFRLVELLVLDDYPAANRWGTFYGQSASVVGFLAGRDRPARLLEFVGIAQTRGYEAALREIYQIGGVRELERLWMADAKKAVLTTQLTSAKSKRPEVLARPVAYRD